MAGMAVFCRHGIEILKTRLAFIAGLLASFLCVTVQAQNYKPFPGESVNQRTRTIQERVEAIYSAGDYQRALLIYEKDLAPLGDKYAQYMVGYMHFHGQGTDIDKAESLAWFRLAAERGEPLLVRVRDEVLQQVSAADIAESDRIFVDLWKSISDRVLIMELIREDIDILREQTGTRIPGGATTGPMIIYTPSGDTIGPNFYRNVRARLDARLDYLDARVEISDDVIAEEFQRIRIQESEVKDEVAALGNR